MPDGEEKDPKEDSRRISYYMVSFRFSILAVVVRLIGVGCATQQPVSTREASLWRTQLERQQRFAHEAGRIGYIGNAVPSSCN
jgi:hypothetical protein